MADLEVNKVFESVEAAEEYFRARGEMEFFGIIHGLKGVYRVYAIRAKDGRRYHLDLYLDGRASYRLFV